MRVVATPTIKMTTLLSRETRIECAECGEIGTFRADRAVEAGRMVAAHRESHRRWVGRER